jgi:hypothetical protein
MRSVSLIILILAIFVILLLIGAAIYMNIEEDVNLRDAFSLMTASATTIGSTKDSPKSSGGIWFMNIYSILLVTYYLGSFFVIFDVLL